LIDTIYPYNSEELIVGGMQRLGFDASDIKYVLISHAHSDHIGGAEMLQNRGQRILMDPRDWDLVEQFPNRYLTMAPKRDLEAEDGKQLKLGDTTITIWRTPGHTAGTLSYTFTVFDNGRPVNVAYSGGTGFIFPSTTPDLGIKDFRTYIDSQKHIAAKAAETNATVIPIEPLATRQRRKQDQDDSGTWGWASPIRGRRRHGAALLPGHAALRQGGADQAGAHRVRQRLCVLSLAHCAGLHALGGRRAAVGCMTEKHRQL